MRLVCRFFVLPIILLFSVVGFSQTSNEAKIIKQKQKLILLEQILSDIPNLKLAQNRAVAYAKVGDLLWDFDKKRANREFQKSFDELIQARSEMEEYLEKRSLFSDGNNIRQNILQTIGGRDAGLALEFMRKSRDEKILKGLGLLNQPNNPFSTSTNASNYLQLAQAETQLEQQLLNKAADQNPEQAVKLLKDAVNAGVTYQTFDLLKRLFEKDSAAANSLASKIADELNSTKFTSENNNAYVNYIVAVAFLYEFSRKKSPNEKYLNLNEDQMRLLAEKVLNYVTEYRNFNSRGEDPRINSIIEKFFPEKAKQFKTDNNVYKRNVLYGEFNEEVTKLFENNSSSQTIIEKSKKYPDPVRRQVIQSLSNKLFRDGDKNSARIVLKQNFSGDVLDEMLRNLDWSLANKAVENGNFDEASGYINKLHKNMQHGFLLNLARAVYSKNPVENKDRAKDFLRQALSEASPELRDSRDFTIYMSVITELVGIDTDEGFQLFESIIPKLNELSNAAKLLYEFNGNGNVRNGEFLLSSGNSWGFDFGSFQQQGKVFVNADFDRTLKLIDSFENREIRIDLKLQLAQSAFN